MPKVTLEEEEIQTLEEYFKQIQLARPIMYYEESADKARQAADSWEEIWKYLVELDDYSLSGSFAEHALDIGFFMIYSQSVTEYLLNLLLIDEFDIPTEFIRNYESGPSLISLRIDDKLNLLKMSGINLSDEISDKQVRNRFAHDVQISDYFLTYNDKSSIREIVDTAFETPNDICEIVYDMSISEVAETVHQVHEFYTADSLESAPAGAILMELIEKPEGITLDTDDLASRSKEEMREELNSRGFSPESYKPDSQDIYPQIDATKPVAQTQGVVIDRVQSSAGLSSQQTNRLGIVLVCYNSKLDDKRYLYSCDIAIEIEDVGVVTKEVDSFQDYNFRRRAEPTIEFDIDEIPNKPWVTVSVTAIAESEDNYFTDFWQKEVPNIDWIRRRRRYAESNITSAWLMLDTHPDFDLDSYSDGDSLFEHLSVDDEFMKRLPHIEGLLNSARASLGRANDPVKVIDASEYPSAVKIIPTENGSRLEVLEGSFNAIEHMNQKLKKELNSMLFEYDYVKEYHSSKGGNSDNS